MRIRTLILVTVVVALLLVMAMGLMSWRFKQQLTVVNATQLQAQVSNAAITDLLVFSHEFARYGEERAAQQWKDRFALLSDTLIAEALKPSTELPRLPEDARRRAAALGELFDQLQLASQARETPLQLRRKALLLDQMLVNTTLLAEIISRRGELLHDEHVRIQEQQQRLNHGLFLLMLALVSIVAILLIWRVVRPLERFQEAVSAVAGGDLTVRVASTSKDELGELSRAFDAMAVDMVTDLRRQVAERQSAEENVRRVSRLYAVLSRCNHAIVHSRSTDELFQTVCTTAVTLGGMKMAWIGMVDEETQSVLPIASFGDETGYLSTVQISVDAGSPFGQGPHRYLDS